MSYPKLAALVEKLSVSTARGATEWSKTEFPNAFQASFASYSVRISLTDPMRGDYLLQIFDMFGDLVEEVSDDQLRDSITNPTSLMKGIYDAARRKSMGVEDALDAILRQLGN